MAVIIATWNDFRTTIHSKQQQTDNMNKHLDIKIGSSTLTFVWIPPGEFIMGSDSGFDDEKPAHREVVKEGFWMLETPVTQEVYQAVMGSNPSYNKSPNNPVECVSWHDAVAFNERLRAHLPPGLTPDLPTEVEWEYAAKGGATTEPTPLTNYAWFSNNCHSTMPVKQKLPNDFGLYDMLGNVWEWCKDEYDADAYKNRGGL